MNLIRLPRRNATLALVATLLVLVVACSSGTKASGNAKTAKGTVKVEIDAGHNEVPFQKENAALKKMGINLQLVGLPFSGQYEKIVTELVANKGAFDLVVFPPYMIGDFVAKGFLLPLDKYTTQVDPKLSDVLQPFRDPTLKVNGHLYALPYDGDWHMLYYRSDLFSDPKEKAAFKAKYGYDLAAPTTWKQYMDIAQFFTRPPSLYGTAFFGQRGFSYAWWADIWAGLGGGHWFDNNMNPQINDAAGVKALQMMTVEKTYSPPDVMSYGYEELRDAFLAGKTAMIVQWGDVGKKANDPSVSKIRGKVGFSTVPQGRTYMPYSRVMAVATGSGNPAAAYAVAAYMTSPQVSDRYVADPATGEDIFRFSQLNPSLYTTIPPNQRAAYVDAARANLQHGFPELNIPGAPRYLDALDLAVNKALTGQASPAAALNAAAAQWKQITQQEGTQQQKAYYQHFVQAFETAGLKY
jgi:multiple sugar transport system substrate-binding protein